MYNICIFAGTTEGRNLVEFLSEYENINLTACVATEYGESLIIENNCNIIAKRLNEEEMINLFNHENFDLVIDSTHPYAQIVTENIVSATSKTNTQYLRVVRESSFCEYGKYFDTTAQAVEYLKTTTGNIMLTTGSKTLGEFTTIQNYKERLYPRVLPFESSLEICNKYDYIPSHVIAMQGPFSLDFNVSLIKMLNIKIVVTKQTGKTGGFDEKIEAAKATNTTCVIIGKPNDVNGKSLDQTIKYLCQKFALESKAQVDIIGIGMGSDNCMTVGAKKALENCDVILGAKRIAQSCNSYNKPMEFIFTPNAILQFIKANPQYKKVAVVMSGDIGFYSGAKKLYDTLQNFKINNYPALSSPIYLSSKLKLSWDDMKLISLHGRQCNFIDAVKKNQKVFALVGGDYDVNRLCNELCEYGLGECLVSVGENLSYENEKITTDMAKNLVDNHFDVLSCVIIQNKNANSTLKIAIDDSEFIRAEKVPMTKSEVRGLSVAKLNLNKNSIVYDVGAGSGSVSIEMALNAYEGKVYAIERKTDAVELIHKNKNHFKVSNLEVIEGLAPQAMQELEAPTHAFIGGSSGNMKDIVKMLLEKNDKVEIVINAITIESMAEAIEVIKMYNFNDYEITQVAISKAKKLGSYNLMMGQNPIYIVRMKKS